VLTESGDVYLSGRTHDVQQAIRHGRMAETNSVILKLCEATGVNNFSIDALVPKKVDLPEQDTKGTGVGGLTVLMGASVSWCWKVTAPSATLTGRRNRAPKAHDLPIPFGPYTTRARYIAWVITGTGNAAQTLALSTSTTLCQ
jgi:hypothetical protein